MKFKIEKGYISIISPKLIWICGLSSGSPKIARAAALFPFIIFASKEEQVPWTINHEKIHFQQQLETLFIGLLLLELFETIYAVVILKKSFPEAYKWRSSEQEAYLNQGNQDYLKERRLWSIFRYTRYKKNFSFGNPGEIIIH